MVSPARVDALTDIAYGALIALSIVLIATLNVNDIGVAFGIGVFASYVIHPSSGRWPGSTLTG